MKISKPTLACILLLLGWYDVSDASEPWFVKKITVNSAGECESACALSIDCASWSLHNPSNSQPSTNNEKIEKANNVCYIESAVFEKLKLAYPEPFLRNSTLASGSKVKNTWKSDFHVDTLIKGPIALDSTSVLNFERHFVRGCSYTVSMWVWLWKKLSLPEANVEHSSNPQLSVFSTRRINPSTSNAYPLYPTIMFNVGRPPQHQTAFFSASKDSAGFYSGVWGRNFNNNNERRSVMAMARRYGRPGNLISSSVDDRNGQSSHIRYHEWVHYALTVNETTLMAYINGEFVEYLNLFPVDHKNSCPYSNWTTQEFQKLYNRNNKASNSKEGKDRINNNQQQIYHKPVANTILQIGANRGDRAFVGMVQDAIIISNKALEQTYIRELMRIPSSHRSSFKNNSVVVDSPEQFPTLANMMKAYGLHSLQGLCTVDWVGDSYQLYDWGICPEIVCGYICLSEEFFLGIGVYESIQNEALTKKKWNSRTSKRHVYQSTKLNPYVTIPLNRSRDGSPAEAEEVTRLLAQEITAMLDPMHRSELVRYRGLIQKEAAKQAAASKQSSQVGDNTPTASPSKTLTTVPIDYDQLAADVFEIPFSELEEIIDGIIAEANAAAHSELLDENDEDEEEDEYYDDEEGEEEREEAKSSVRHAETETEDAHKRRQDSATTTGSSNPLPQDRSDVDKSDDDEDDEEDKELQQPRQRRSQTTSQTPVTPRTLRHLKEIIDNHLLEATVADDGFTEVNIDEVHEDLMEAHIILSDELMNAYIDYATDVANKEYQQLLSTQVPPPSPQEAQVLLTKLRNRLQLEHSLITQMNTHFRFQATYYNFDQHTLTNTEEVKKRAKKVKSKDKDNEKENSNEKGTTSSSSDFKRSRSSPLPPKRTPSGHIDLDALVQSALEELEQEETMGQQYPQDQADEYDENDKSEQDIEKYSQRVDSTKKTQPSSQKRPRMQTYSDTPVDPKTLRQLSDVLREHLGSAILDDDGGLDIDVEEMHEDLRELKVILTDELVAAYLEYSTRLVEEEEAREDARSQNINKGKKSRSKLRKQLELEHSLLQQLNTHFKFQAQYYNYNTADKARKGTPSKRATATNKVSKSRQEKDEKKSSPLFSSGGVTQNRPAQYRTVAGNRAANHFGNGYGEGIGYMDMYADGYGDEGVVYVDEYGEYVLADEDSAHYLNNVQEFDLDGDGYADGYVDENGIVYVDRDGDGYVDAFYDDPYANGHDGYDDGYGDGGLSFEELQQQFLQRQGQKPPNQAASGMKKSRRQKDKSSNQHKESKKQRKTKHQQRQEQETARKQQIKVENDENADNTTTNSANSNSSMESVSLSDGVGQQVQSQQQQKQEQQRSIKSITPAKLDSKQLKMRQRKNNKGSSSSSTNITVYNGSSNKQTGARAGRTAQLTYAVIDAVVPTTVRNMVGDITANVVSGTRQALHRVAPSLFGAPAPDNAQASTSQISIDNDPQATSLQVAKSPKRLQAEAFLQAMIMSTTSAATANSDLDDSVASSFSWSEDLFSLRMMQAQEVYAAAVTWLSGRHLNMSADNHLSVHDWRQISNERVLSCLFLTLFLADDATSDLDKDVEWNFDYPSVLAHPARTILGFKAGYDAEDSLMGVIHNTNHHLFRQVSDTRNNNISRISTTLLKSKRLLQALGGVSSLDQLLYLDKSIEDDTPKHIPQGLMNASGPASSASETNWLEVISHLKPSLLPTLLSDAQEDYPEGGHVRTLHKQFTPLRQAGITDTQLSAFKEQLSLEQQHSSQLLALTHKLLKAPSDDVISEPDSQTHRDCAAAAAYYFPLSQYVVSHFHEEDAGISLLEEVALEDNNFLGHGGQGDNLHVSVEADAALGDVNAQLWLARRYRWGFGGLEPNIQLARQWYQRAADQGNAEGLYNMGVFNLHGLAGFAKNEAVASDYFMKAANGSKPFPMAVHALGNLYKDSGNTALARKYYERAAELGSPEGHFSYAMMLREGVGGPIDVPLAVIHLSVAASHNHIRSIGFLAHGLYDAESWLGQYGREAQLNGNNPTDSVRRQHTQGAQAITSRFRYNVSKPIAITLPLAASHTSSTTHNTITLPSPLRHDCESALPLLKHLAEMGYRTNDLSKAALNAYLTNDFWSAVEYYDELSDLGLGTAHENVVYMYEKLKHIECEAHGTIAAAAHNNDTHNADAHIYTLKSLLRKLKEASTTASEIEQSYIVELLAENDETISLETFQGDEYDLHAHTQTHPQTQTDESNATAGSSSNAHKIYEPVLPSDLSPQECEFYFDRMIAHRWLQRASLGDNTEALRELAMLARKYHSAQQHQQLQGGRTLIEAPPAVVAQLYALAAAQGDAEALVSLGWLLHAGGDGAFPKNRTAARAAFAAASRWEARFSWSYLFDDDANGREAAGGASSDPNNKRINDDDESSIFGSVYGHTQGLAPVIALWWLWLEELLERFQLLQVFANAYISVCKSLQAHLDAVVQVTLSNNELMEVIVVGLVYLKQILDIPHVMEGLVVGYLLVLGLRNRRRMIRGER